MSEIIFEEYPEYEEKKGQPVPGEEDVWRPAKNRLNELLGRSPLGQEVMAYGEHIIKVNDLSDEKLGSMGIIDLPKVSMSKYVSDATHTVEEIAKAHLEKLLGKATSEESIKKREELIKKHIARIFKINDLTSRTTDVGKPPEKRKPFKAIIIVLPKFCIDSTDKTFFS